MSAMLLPIVKLVRVQIAGRSAVRCCSWHWSVFRSREERCSLLLVALVRVEIAGGTLCADARGTGPCSDRGRSAVHCCS